MKLYACVFPVFLPCIVDGFIKILLQLFAFAITCLTLLCLHLIFSLAFLFLQIMKSAAHKICTNYSAASTDPPLRRPHLRSFLFFAFRILPTLYFFIYAKCIEKINKIINESRTRLVWFFLALLFYFFLVLLFLLFCYFIAVYSPLVSLSSQPAKPANNESRKTQKYKTVATPTTTVGARGGEQWRKNKWKFLGRCSEIIKYLLVLFWNTFLKLFWGIYIYIYIFVKQKIETPSCI